MLQKRKPNILKVLDRLGRGEDMVSSMFDDLFHFHGFSPLQGIPNPGFSPALDFIEKEKEYIVKIEIPGIEKDGIDIEIDDDILIIKGEKKKEHEEKNDEIYVYERNYGTFRREVRLPTNCDKEKIEAEHKNGVLNLILPKVKIKETKKKKITIRS